jgi:hypothetical protein
MSFGKDVLRGKLVHFKHVKLGLELGQFGLQLLHPILGRRV